MKTDRRLRRRGRAYLAAGLSAVFVALLATDTHAHGKRQTTCLSLDGTNSHSCWKKRTDAELELVIGGSGAPFEPPVVCGIVVDTPGVARSVLRGRGPGPCGKLRRDALVATFNIRRSLLVGDGLLGSDAAECFGIDDFRIVLRCGDRFIPDESTPDPDDALAVDETTPIEDLLALSLELCDLSGCPGNMKEPCSKTIHRLSRILYKFNKSRKNKDMCPVCPDDETPPVLSCPVGTVEIECQGPKGAPIDYEVTATDNCDPSPKVVCFPPPGTVLPIGAVKTVVCAATDLNHEDDDDDDDDRGPHIGHHDDDDDDDDRNISRCKFSVAVVDTTAPRLNCPSEPIVVNCVRPGDGGAVVDYPQPTATDVCDDSVDVVCDPPSGSFFPLGTTTVTCTAADGHNNVSTCTFEVVVVEDPGVQLICSPDIVTECRGPEGAVVEYPLPMVSSLCQSPPAPICEPPSGSVFPLGDTVVTCSTTDDDGNRVECQFTVSVVDTQSPMIVCPDDVTVECATPAGTPVSFSVSASDLCDPDPIVVCDPPSGSVFPPGSTVVACMAMDESGNTRTCEFTVNVVDTTPPTISCPAGPVRADCDVVDPFPGAVVNFPDPLVEDLCDADVSFSCEPPSGSLFPIGETTVRCVAKDASGNTAECSFIVEVVDVTPPMLVCLEDIVVECDGPEGRVVEYSTPRVADACDEFPALVCDPPSGSLFPIGDTVVTCTATDFSGNSITCSFNVIVEDNTPPSISCPADIVVECESPAGTIVDFTAIASDTCDPNPVVECNPAPGSTFPPGQTVVRCSATDFSGNETTCEFTVNVVDTTPPELSCPEEPIVAECTGPEGAAVTLNVGAIDACQDTVEVTCDPPSGSVFPIGTTIVTCTATDASGNSSQCQLAVIVADTTPPTIACPVDVMAIECDENLLGVIQYPLPNVSDVCDPDPVVTCNPPQGALLPIGIHTITCTATDDAGNTATCQFELEVVDTVPPQLTCTTDIIRECAGPDGAEVVYEQPTVSDSCNPAPNLACLPGSGSLFPLGTSTVTCTADDQNGNLVDCRFVVQVIDNTPPLIQCPGDISALCTSAEGAVVNFAPVVVDTCDPNPVVACDPPSGSVFPIGETTVTCTATDWENNVAECTFTVVVRDDTPPAIACLPDFELECGEGGTAVVDFPLPIPQDNCDPAPQIRCDPPPGTPLEPGPHVITCTATDTAGNESSCQFTVTVVDTTAPELICPPDMTVECESFEGTVVNYDLPMANDACDGERPVECVPPSGSTFALGSTEVICTSTDSRGNEIQCSFVITVVDTTPPVVQCPEMVEVEAESSAGAMVDFRSLITITDDCDPDPQLDEDPISGSMFPVGDSQVTCRGRDAEGNETTTTFTVRVQDTTPPELVCPPDIFDLECTTNGTSPHKPPGWPPGNQPEPNECTVVLQYELPIATDNIDGAVQVTCDPPPGTKIMLGSHTVVCQARDAAGNETVCTFDVNVVVGIRAFIRGDANGDSKCDIGDPIYLINWMFLGNQSPTCMDAGDCNDDGHVDLGDVVFDLNFVFSGGRRPPDPYLPLCGLDPTEDDLDCEGFLPCE